MLCLEAAGRERILMKQAIAATIARMPTRFAWAREARSFAGDTPFQARNLWPSGS